MWSTPRATTPRARQPTPRPAPRRYVLERVDLGGRLHELSGPCRIGSDASNDLVVDEATVSALHCELDVSARGAWIRDDGSSNGTEVDGLMVREAALRDGSLIRLGNVSLRFRWAAVPMVDSARLDRSPRAESRGALGALVGSSPLLRDCRAKLSSVARSAGPVLLEGESGTGKSMAAELLHEHRGLALLPFLAVECGALPEVDLAGLLFGRERPRRLSIFEEAGAGTLLLDEVSALSLELQARLVPVFERRELSRAGSPIVVPVHAQLLSSSREPLRRRVNAGQFRAELYFRLGNPVRLPALREHLEDLPELIAAWLSRHEVPKDEVAALCSRAFAAKLAEAAWPGNVRELFNHLERCVLLHRAASPRELTAPMTPTDPGRPYFEARGEAVAAFEHDYAQALLARSGGNVARAARAAGIDRAYLHRLLRRHGLGRPPKAGRDGPPR
ncbi:MAG: sigma 54-interacting transcriptional regulator [Archangium sp.]|nr:sigma 54-interacting transcriptional regulator [Archangium sp.]